MKEICRPPCYGSESGICDRSGRGCTVLSPNAIRAFVVGHMQRHHPRVVYRLGEVPSGWRLTAWHPDTSEMVTLDIREQRVFPGEEGGAFRQLANRIDTLLAPDQSWRLHADYV